MGKKKRKVVVHLELTEREAAMLTHGACELYHHMVATQKHEIFGALIVNKNVLASRSVWRKIEAQVKIEEWE